MTRLLEKAIAKARELSDEDQDAVAVAVLTMTEQGAPIAPLDDETVQALAAGEVEFELSVGGQPSYWWLLSAE